RHGRGAAAQRLSLQGDVLLGGAGGRRLVAAARRLVDGDVLGGVFAAFLLDLLRAPGQRPAARPARTAALDAFSRRVSGADLPGGRDRAGLQYRPAAPSGGVLRTG